MATNPQPFAYFKDWRLGDCTANQRPNVKPIGAGRPEAQAATSGDRATLKDPGKSWSWEVEVVAFLQKSGSEGHIAFNNRVMQFGLDAITAGGIRPAGEALSAGVLAGGLDDSLIYGFDNAEAIGGPRTIELDSSGLEIASGEVWFIFDPSTGKHELVQTTSSGTDELVIGAGLVYGYTDVSKGFKVAWAFKGMLLIPELLMKGDDEGSNEVVQDISVNFLGIEGPTLQASP